MKWIPRHATAAKQPRCLMAGTSDLSLGGAGGGSVPDRKGAERAGKTDQ